MDVKERVDGSISITVKFDNLVVQAEPEYLINNPGGDNHNTTITFQLTSAQKKYCSATISIYSSAGQLVKQETLNNLLCPGTYTYQWDNKITQGTPPVTKLSPRGIYPYDIEVVGACPYDTDARCSKNLKITQTKVDILSGKVGYILEDTAGKSAYSAKITVFNKSIQKLCMVEDVTLTNLPQTSNPIWNEKILNIELLGIGPWTFLVSAVDDHPELDKAHRRKPALQKNQRAHLPTHTILLDPGHGNSDTGTLGSWYWDPQKKKNVDRFNKTEAQLNEDLCSWLRGILEWHNNPQNKPQYIFNVEDVERLGWIDRVNWVLRRTLNTQATPVKLLVSIHHNGKSYPYSGAQNFAMYNKNNYAVAQANDKNYYRFEKFDEDLADSVTNRLRQYMEVGQLTLPVDQRLMGHRLLHPGDPSSGDPNEVTGPIRENEKEHSLTYEDPHKVTSTQERGGAMVIRPYCSVTLLEIATITNYDDEDYRMSPNRDQYLASAIYYGIIDFISSHPQELKWDNMRYQQ